MATTCAQLLHLQATPSHSPAWCLGHCPGPWGVSSGQWEKWVEIELRCMLTSLVADTVLSELRSHLLGSCLRASPLHSLRCLCYSRKVFSHPKPHDKSKNIFSQKETKIRLVWIHFPSRTEIRSILLTASSQHVGSWSTNTVVTAALCSGHQTQETPVFSTDLWWSVSQT